MQNDIWGTNAEIPYWWGVTTQEHILVGLTCHPNAPASLLKIVCYFFHPFLIVRLVVVMHPFPLDVRLRTHLPQKETHKLVMCHHFLSVPHLPRLVLVYTRSQ